MSKRTCWECGGELTAKGHFCSTPCRKAFNNRRALRGAQLYDLFMEVRHNRAAAREENLWSVACRLASQWKEDDDKAGRRTHGDPRRMIEDNPFLVVGLKR